MRPLEYHLELGARLAPLRECGVLILASGNVVHNLRRVRWDQPNAAFDWAQRFDDAVTQQLADDPGRILDVTRHPDYALAVPTPDHFIPLLYVAAASGAADLPANVPADRNEHLGAQWGLESGRSCAPIGAFPMPRCPFIH